MVRNIFVFCFAFVVAPLAGAQELVPMPAQPDGVAWPTHGWESGALPAETADKVQELLDVAMVGGRHDLIIVRLALMEENDANWNADLQWNLALTRAFP